ncbi:MAG: YraN family protein [Acidobacteriota bacterium]
MKAPFRGLDHRARGRLGEVEARDYLAAQGYRVLEKNFSCRSGEIDVIAEDRGVLCFIEIKARASREFGSAIEAISATKQRRLAKAASLYLATRPIDMPCRFDVVAMDLEAGEWRFTLVRDAFQLTG